MWLLGNDPTALPAGSPFLTWGPAGGMAVLMYWLYRDLIVAFRKEREKDRKAWAAMFESQRKEAERWRIRQEAILAQIADTMRREDRMRYFKERLKDHGEPD